MYYQNEVDSMDKKQRTRIIAVATAVAVVILLLIVAIIVTATNKAAKNTSKGDDVAAEASAEKDLDRSGRAEGTDTEEGKSGTIGNISTKTESDAKNDDNAEKANTATSSEDKTDAAVSADASAMPTTGPMDVWPIALILGATTMCVSSFAMAKREQ